MRVSSPLDAPEDLALPGVDPSAPPVSRPSYSFFTGEEFRERRSSLPDENDALARLTIDASGASGDDKLSANLGLGLWWEVDGQPPADSVNSFDSIHGTPGSPFWLDVYRLNIEYKPDGLLRLLRVGRQDAEHGRPATFDGADAEFNVAPRVQLFAFGGRTVHFFEIDPKIFEDWIGSAGANIRVNDDIKLELDYRILRDSVPTQADVSVFAPGPVLGVGQLPQTLGVGPVVQTLFTDNTYGGTLQFRHGGWALGRIWARWIGNAWESVGGAGRIQTADAQAGIEAKLDIQPVTLDELNEFDNAYFLTLGQSLPHLKATLDAWKAFETGSGIFSAHLGGDVRQLLSGTEGLFNHNLVRAYLLATASKILGSNFYASVTGEFDRDGFNAPDGTLTASANLGWSNQCLKFEGGTYFQRWRYVYYEQPEEFANVRGYYADASYRLNRKYTFRGRYSYEIFDRILQTFTVSLSQAF